MVKALFVIGLFSCYLSANAQDEIVEHEKGLAYGLEQDFLPYLANGYFGAAWIGKKHVRVRVLGARVKRPEFITPSGFVNNRVSAYAVLCDYYLKSDWVGWWAGAGLVYWDSSVQKTLAGNTAHYTNTLLNGSLGYQLRFYRKFYLSPWAGLNLRVGGTKTVVVDGDSFTTPILNPEASLKVGWYFTQNR
ncbi:MAG: hypothetical protein AB7O48_18130 [Cyclobacteriaceae bacterium]